MNKPTKQQLLDHYSRREPKAFSQFDGCTGGEPYCSISAYPVDGDGDTIFGGETHELMSGAPAVRVLITEGTSQEDAVRLLEKILEWVKRAEQIPLPAPPPLPERDPTCPIPL